VNGMFDDLYRMSDNRVESSITTQFDDYVKEVALLRGK